MHLGRPHTFGAPHMESSCVAWSA